MSFRLKEEMNNLPILDVLFDDDFNLHIELGNFAKNMKEVVGVIDFSSPSYQDMMRKKLTIC
jgi:hypothetical protein